MGVSFGASESLPRRSSRRACCAADIGSFTSNTPGSGGRSSARKVVASRDSGSVSFLLASLRPVGAAVAEVVGIPVSAGMLPGAKDAATDAKACAKSALIDGVRNESAAPDARGSTRRDELESG